MDKNTIACCANCKHCLEYPRGNLNAGMKGRKQYDK